MRIYRGIGMMTGTSMDGADLAHCAFWEKDGQWEYELLASETVPLEESWLARLSYLEASDARTYARTHVYLGHYFGRMIAQFIEDKQLLPEFVATHGQTIFHQPEKNYTSQIGDGETIASYLTCPLVTNFRNKDVAVGGQGAPLVPFGEALLFPKHRLFMNLGGFANLTALRPGKGPIAFDIAACNLALNWLAAHLDPPLAYDSGGRIARSGKLDGELLEALNTLSFYRTPPPKSLGTEWLNAAVLPLIRNEDIPLEDRMHTYVVHLTYQLRRAVEKCGGKDEPILVTGGGVYNKFLMEKLKERLAPLKVDVTPVSVEISDNKEAILFAFLGLNTLLGRPNILSSVTGAPYDVMGGSIHLPARGWIPLI